MLLLLYFQQVSLQIIQFLRFQQQKEMHKRNLQLLFLFIFSVLILVSSKKGDDKQQKLQDLGEFYPVYLSSGPINQNIKIKISSDQVQVKGCNSFKAYLQYSSSSKSFQTGNFKNQGKFCPNDQAQKIAAALSSAKQAYWENGELVFENNLGNKILRLSNQQSSLSSNSNSSSKTNQTSQFSNNKTLTTILTVSNLTKTQKLANSSRDKNQTGSNIIQLNKTGINNQTLNNGSYFQNNTVTTFISGSKISSGQYKPEKNNSTNSSDIRQNQRFDKLLQILNNEKRLISNSVPNSTLGGLSNSSILSAFGSDLFNSSLLNMPNATIDRNGTNGTFFRSFSSTVTSTSAPNSTLWNVSNSSLLRSLPVTLLNFNINATNSPNSPLNNKTSSKQTLKGKYEIELPKIQLQVSQKRQLVLKGKCNNNYNLLIFIIGDNVSFGQANLNKNCKDDQMILNIVLSAAKIGKDKDSYVLYNNKNQPLLRLNLLSQMEKNGSKTLPTGSYSASLPGLALSFDDDRYYISGCDGRGYNYEADGNGNWSMMEEKSECNQPLYKYLDDALRRSSKYKSVDNGYGLLDSSGSEKARLITK